MKGEMRETRPQYSKVGSNVNTSTSMMEEKNMIEERKIKDDDGWDEK